VLQISSDERARSGRVAEQFSEEDLARFLQIMLRTYDEIGYRQEQRFHLELGVLKLVHAQRILPLEQMLSQTAGEASTPRPPAQAMPAAAGRSIPAPPGAQPSPFDRPDSRNEAPSSRAVSPFAADRARKSGGHDPEMSGAPNAGSQAQSVTGGVAVAMEDPPTSPASQTDPKVIFGAVLEELEDAGHKMLASTLEQGSVALQENTLTITVAQPAAVIDVMMGAEPKRLANAAASRAGGRPVKVNVASGAAAKNGGAAAAVRPVRNGASARSRAAEDPVVQRMQEKFGAEIRTVIDHRQDK